jgi:hypothetical protein
MSELEPTLNIKALKKPKRQPIEPWNDPEAFHASGKYDIVDSRPFIRQRARYEKNTLVTAKLPRPVAVKTIEIIKEQPAINLNNPWYMTLNDLDFKEQEEVLGKDPNDLYTIQNSKLMERLRKTQEVQPYINPPPRLNDQQIKQLFERI